MSSPPSTPLNHIRVTAVTVSLEQAKRWRRLRSGELHIGPHRHMLISDHGELRQMFHNAAIELTPDTHVALHYKTLFRSLPKMVQLDVANLFASFSASQAEDFELLVSQDGIRVVFDCQIATGRTLTPTTDAIFEDHPRFRVLVIGRSGVGKSSLIRTAFGIDTAYSSDFERGEANIEEGLVSVVNKRFILHDSLGFEAAENVNYDTVKKFIRRRQTCAPEDRLHAVWFCVPVPQVGQRLLEAAAEDFFKTKKETMVPITVVYTKADRFMNEWLVNSAEPIQQYDDDRQTELALLEVKSRVEEKHKEINQFAGESLPYALVSTKEKYEYTLQELIELTSNQAGPRDAAEAQITSETTLIAAQRVDPNLKIKGTIDVGRQKYWVTLRASPVFHGNTTWNCLSVIHTDIVAVWNFNDPDGHLSDNHFMELVAKMAVEVGTSSVSKPTQEILASIRSSLVAAIFDTLGTISNPAAPIVLPAIVDFTSAMRPYGVHYHSAENVQQLFIAYIVDLTHILETLNILTAHDHKKLTRRTIKLAYHSYHDSGLMMQTHSNIEKYRELDGRDAALEMIENSIKSERYGDASLRSYYTEISKLDLAKFHLDQEEEW